MTQAAFARALLDPDAAAPDGVTDAQGRPCPKRFAVYRNNVTASLIRVLEAAFPVVRKLVGDEFFAAMAAVFLRAHPPKSRLMMLYGVEFPAFLASFPPVAHLGYLADVARLEQAIRESYHAADAEALAALTLAELPESTLMAARLTLAPSLRLVRSVWPIHMIWQANTDGGPPPVPGGQDVLILRAGFDPALHLLPAGGGAFLSAALAGQSLAAALAGVDQTFNLTAVLGLLIQGQAIVGIAE
jgi:hypothetical protein